MPTRLRRGLAATSLAALLSTPLSACSEQDAVEQAQESTDTLLGHVHGLGIDPESGVLYVAAHHGVFTFDGGSPERVADRWQDTMAFTVVGPRHLLASGHPDLREEGPVHLGLVESTDGAQSWRTLSLAGDADFHALDATTGAVYGYDALSRSVLTSTDGRDWETVTDGLDVVDLAVHPERTEEVLLTSPDGSVHRHPDAGGGGSRLRGTPPLRHLDWADGATLGALGPDGSVYTSADGGDSWLRTSDVPGDPEAFDADGETWHAATSTGIYRSLDSGTSWELLLAT